MEGVLFVVRRVVFGEQRVKDKDESMAIKFARCPLSRRPPLPRAVCFLICLSEVVQLLEQKVPFHVPWPEPDHHKVLLLGTDDWLGPLVSWTRESCTLKGAVLHSKVQRGSG